MIRGQSRISNWFVRLIEARVEGERNPCSNPECEDPRGVRSIDLVCPSANCGTPVGRPPILGLSPRTVLWLARLAIFPLSFGVAVGFAPTVYVFGAIITLGFIYVLFDRHPEVRAYSLYLHCSAALVIGYIAFANIGPTFILIALGLAITLVGLGVAFPVLVAPSLASGFLQAQALSLVVWVPVAAIGFATYAGGELLLALGLTSVLLILGMILGAIPEAIPAAYRVPIAKELRLVYVSFPKERPLPLDLEAFALSQWPTYIRPLILFGNAAIKTVSLFRRASVAFWNRVIKAVYGTLNASIRIVHRILLRFREILRAYATFMRNLYASAMRTFASFLRVVGWPAVLTVAGLCLLAALSHGITRYVEEDYRFGLDGWWWTFVFVSEITAFVVLYLCALSLLVRPSGRLWTSFGNFLPEQVFFGVLFFWGNSMVAFLGPLTFKQIPSLENLPDSPYRYGPATTVATLILGLTLAFVVSRRLFPTPRIAAPSARPLSQSPPQQDTVS